MIKIAYKKPRINDKFLEVVPNKQKQEALKEKVFSLYKERQSFIDQRNRLWEDNKTLREKLWENKRYLENLEKRISSLMKIYQENYK